MTNSADSDQLASEEETKLICIYTVCKGRVYPDSAGPGLNVRTGMVRNLCVPIFRVNIVFSKE